MKYSVIVTLIAAAILIISVLIIVLLSKKINTQAAKIKELETRVKNYKGIIENYAKSRKETRVEVSQVVGNDNSTNIANATSILHDLATNKQ